MAAACACARSLGAESHGILAQEDTYFHVSHGRLKLRIHDSGPAELIAYERPDRSGDRWSNYRRVDVSAVPDLKEALTSALGVACVVRKRRHLFLLPDARIHLDEVETLGAFLEFEVTNEDRAVAEQVMAGLRRGFGLEKEEGIAGSYSDMIIHEAIFSDHR